MQQGHEKSPNKLT